MLQIDLSNDLKEELGLKSRFWFTLFEPVIQGFWISLDLPKHTRMWSDMPQYV